MTAVSSFFARICRDTLHECQWAQRLSPVGFESRTGWLKRWIPHLNGHFALLVCRFCVSFPWNLWHITQIDASHLTVSGFILSKVIIYGCFTGVFSRAELCIHVVSRCPRCSIRIGWFCIARFTPWTIPMFSFSAGSSVYVYMYVVYIVYVARRKVRVWRLGKWTGMSPVQCSCRRPEFVPRHRPAIHIFDELLLWPFTNPKFNQGFLVT